MTRPGSWPASWVGTWVAADGKTVRLVRTDEGITVTVAPGPGRAPYRSAPLLRGGIRRIERRPGSCWIDDRERRYLEIEAGTRGLGPTYRLYPAVQDGEHLRHAGIDTAVDLLLLLPNTGIGLYDDWEDDLGVPWAYPLRPLRRTP
jgi:hypothetical protein